MNEYLHRHVVPFEIRPGAGADEIVRRMGHTSFQARNLALAADIWCRMLADRTTIMLGLAGALVPAGMREIIVYLIEHRMVDVIVSTGANLYHDLYETMGFPHWQGSPEDDDVELGRLRINRFFDVLAPETDFFQGERWVTEFALTLEPDRPYHTREYFRLIGEALQPLAKREGILTAAAKHGVPIYCPALGDSVHGIAIAAARTRSGQRVLFDIIGDVMETSWIAASSESTGVIYLGGGTPKNFVQQTEVTAYIFNRELPGHKYGIQITMDQPQWGGLSGCTFDEAISWRKIAPEARTVTLYSETTVALPLIVSAVAERAADVIAARQPPRFDFAAMPGA